MRKSLCYAIGSGTVVAVAACFWYRSRRRNAGDSDSESQVPPMVQRWESQDALPRNTSVTASIASAIFEESDGTVTIQTITNPILSAKSITLTQLKKLLKDMPGQKTLYTVAEELYNLEESAGGALIVVYDCKGGKNPGATMPVKSLAGGKLRNVMRQYAKTLFVDDSEGAPVTANFRAILHGFSSIEHDGPSADKWTQPVLKRMAKDLGESWDTAESIRLLENEPADGALAILSLRGTVVGASSRIDIKAPQIIELQREDGKGTGTKHTAAVCAVEWCRLKKLQGAAIVRSDTGRVTFVCIEATGKLHTTETKAYEIVGL